MVADALARLLRNPSPTCYRSRGVQYSSFMWDYIPIFVKSPWFRSAVIISLPSVSIWKVGQYHCLPRSIWWTLHPKTTLQWRHNEHDGVSNHQPYDCLLNRLFRRRFKKTSKLRVTGLCDGNSLVTGEFPASHRWFPAQRASNAENVSIWWRHHESSIQLKLWFLYIRTLGGGGYLFKHILQFSSYSKSHSLVVDSVQWWVQRNKTTLVLLGQWRGAEQINNADLEWWTETHRKGKLPISFGINSLRPSNASMRR